LYAKALGDYGIDLAAPEEAAARVRGRRLKEALLSALADWEGVTDDEEERQRVAKVYQLAVPADSLRPQLLAAVRARDGAELEKLAKKPAFQDLPASTLVILANKLTAGKEWAAAERLLRAGLERKPGDFWLNHDLGKVLLEQGPSRAEEAIGYLRAALALRSDSPGVYFNLGYALAQKGDQDGAIRCFQAALRIAPNYAMAHNGIGVALEEKGDLDGAILCYQAAVQIDPSCALVHYNLGAALYVKGRRDEAVAAWRVAVAIKQDTAEAYNWLGNALLNEKGRLRDEAVAAFREAIRLAKDYPEAHSGLGSALLEQGKLEEAVAAFRASIGIKKDDAQAHYGLGAALRRQGKLNEAIAAYRDAIEINRAAIGIKPYYADVHCDLGNALRDNGQLDEAIEAWHEAIHLKPDLVNAYVNLGAALCDRKRDYDGAIAAFEKAIRLKPDVPRYHYNLGNALRGKGRLDEAIAKYQEALRLQKDLPEAHQGIGHALRDKDRLDDAIAEYRKEITLYPMCGTAHYNLGDALTHKGEFDEAIAVLHEAIRLKKDFHQAHLDLGNALKAKGDLEGAIREYREAIAINGDYALAYCNLGQTLAQQGRFPQAVAELRRVHELGSRNPHWPYPSAQWLQSAEQLASLDARLPQFLKHEAQPADAAERVQLGWLCQQPYKQLNAAAARLYAQAFAAEPKFADDLKAPHRYNAACAAALAGCGTGKDADQLDDRERARLRHRALTWLQADLAVWRRLLADNEAKIRPALQPTMQRWLGAPEFARVRDPEALAKLPEAERQDWQKLWAEVQELFAKAGGQSSRPEK
jgi:superkiller protein 3